MVFDVSSPVDVPVSTLAMALLFGPALLVWIACELASFLKTRKLEETTMMGLRCTAILAGVLFLCYFCENHWPFEHRQKEYRLDLYWGTFAVLMIASFFTVRKSNLTDFMHRDQTEEWKGWMQFLFLAYHYWKNENNYNDIRVYITCYLWMTGFGNFSFFYMKNDFSLLRVLQMTFRMNFFVFFLMMTMDNPYIVYYICPLHTFFFLFTYASMALWSKFNRDQYGPVVKCVIGAVLLYIVFDGLPQLFDQAFFWLGNQSSGASIGSHGIEWEWYFRTFLDHYSTMWGMIFALNMPFLAEWFKQVESFGAAREWGIKLPIAAILIAATGVWAVYIHALGKSEYNALHCYYSLVPLLAYLFLRNISVTLRTYYFHLLHVFGTITLETYLLQYHILLSDNAGKLLNIVPGWPLLTYCLGSCMHLFCAYQIFHVTCTLRSIVLPNDIGVSLRNCALLAAAVILSCCAATWFMMAQLGMVHLISFIACVGLLASSGFLLQEQGGAEKSSSWMGSVHSTMQGQAAYIVAFLVCAIGLTLLPRRVEVLASGSEGGTMQQMSLHRQWLEHGVNNDMLDGTTSYDHGRLVGFVIGSLAQPWHGAIVLTLMFICLAANDPYFGLFRLFQAIGAPAGAKHISWEQAYGPLLEKLGARPTAGDAEAQVSERTPLTSAH